MAELVLRKDEAGCATLTLNRPDKLNALSVETFVQLRTHLEAIAQSQDVIGLVVLRGAGRCFSAGNDLGAITDGEQAPTPNFKGETVELLATLPQPVICAVHGHCFTGALELALAGDLILAAVSAKFADTHAKWALTPRWGMSQRLPRRVGLVKAREMMLTCRTYSGAEALAMGLVNACVPDADFDAEIASWSAAILANSWFSHRANKALLNQTDGMNIAAGLAHETYRTAGRGPDMQERIAAFTQKRKG